MGSRDAKPATDLRTRIITAMLSEDDVALMADAVIAELGIHEDEMGTGATRRTRIVSDWEKP